jgi:NAD(P)-dependent dehydrogenase (short-subunit alcohol dehydrogenase family)
MIAGKLDGKVAVITGGSSGMALASAKLLVDEGAHVFISGRRQEALDEAVKLIGRNVTGVQADSANLDELDRLFDAVRRERAPSTCCEPVPGRSRRASSARSRNTAFERITGPPGLLRTASAAHL